MCIVYFLYTTPASVRGVADYIPTQYKVVHKSRLLGKYCARVGPLRNVNSLLYGNKCSLSNTINAKLNFKLQKISNTFLFTTWLKAIHTRTFQTITILVIISFLAAIAYDLSKTLNDFPLKVYLSCCFLRTV